MSVCVYVPVPGIGLLATGAIEGAELSSGKGRAWGAGLVTVGGGLGLGGRHSVAAVTVKPWGETRRHKE